MWPRGDSAGRPEGRQAAVIDVGSNSVRLVIYRIDGRALWTVYNEKVVAGLGKDLNASGRLSPEGAEAAILALRRFRAVLEGWRAEEVMVAATAAVRDAADGKAFLKRVKDETGLEIRVLSGEEEARYAALGVICGQPDAQGVVGDLGGSSLELVRLNGHGPVVGARCAPSTTACSRWPTAMRRQNSMPSAAPGAIWRSCTCRWPTIRCMWPTSTR